MYILSLFLAQIIIYNGLNFLYIHNKVYKFNYKVFFSVIICMLVHCTIKNSIHSYIQRFINYPGMAANLLIELLLLTALCADSTLLLLYLFELCQKKNENYMH